MRCTASFVFGGSYAIVAISTPLLTASLVADTVSSRRVDSANRLGLGGGAIRARVRRTLDSGSSFASDAPYRVCLCNAESESGADE